MSHAAKKRFGQHFLREPRTLRRILELGEVAEGDRVLEIGAGDATLTRELLTAGAWVTAVEIDRDLLPGLHLLARENPRLKVVEGDAMKLDFAALPAPMKMISNLPYQVASGIVSELCRWPERFPLMVVMVQREVAARMTAAPGTKAYGTLTLWVRHRHDVEYCRTVPPGAFRPAPKVDSALIRLRARSTPRVETDDEEAYFRLVRAAFAQRRKTILNNLKNFSLPDQPQADWAEALRRAGVEASCRAERLDAEAFARILRAALR